MWPPGWEGGAHQDHQDHQGERWGEQDLLRAWEAFQSQQGDVMDHLRMLEASGQNLLEVLEAESRMLEVPVERGGRQE